MTRVWIAVAFILAMAGNAFAQSPQTVRLCAGNQPTCPFISGANPLPVSGTFSASLGGFLPSLSYGTLTATAASSASTALPTNTGTVAFQNQTTVAVSCTLAAGAATATTNEIIVPAGSTIFIATTGYDHAACINQTGSASNVIVMAGGSGLGTGFGGGGGSGSSGAVFGPTAVGTAAANPPVLIGGTADGTATGAVAVSTIKTGNTAAATDKAVVVTDPTLQAIASASIPACAASPCATVIGDVVLYQGTTPLSATNGLYSNILQGNAVISATNGLYANQLQGNAVLSATNPSFSRPTDGTNAAIMDPCQSAAKVYTPVNVATATNVIIAGVSAKKKYICGIFLYPGAADNIAVYQATTGTACATAPTAIFGGTTPATGFLATATAGFVVGTGASSMAATTLVNTDICITPSAAVQLSGVVVTVDQ